MQHHMKASLAFTALTELRRFVEQTEISLTSNPCSPHTLYEFDSENRLESSIPTDELGPQIIQFVDNSVKYIERNQKDVAPAELAFRAFRRLDRLLIANELRDRHARERDSAERLNGDDWERDVCNILSFLSDASKRRYEHTSPQMTVAYYPSRFHGIEYGVLGRQLLDEYKAILRLCRNAKTVIVTHKGCVVTDIAHLPASSRRIEDVPVPPRLEQARDYTRIHGESACPVVFNLNENGAIEVLAGGEVVFRLINNDWRFLNVGAVLKELSHEVSKCSLDGARIASNLLTLGMDLADHGEGALLYLCDEPTIDVLQSLVVPLDGLIASQPGWPREELNARNRFTQLIGTKRLGLNEEYERLPHMLRDICSIDGATIFSYSGTLLGFGCIVRLNTSGEARHAAEGARSNAAKHISERGCAIKVSSDGDATLFVRGENRGTFF